MIGNQARDDLAFMRSIAAAGEDSQRSFGKAYFAAGLCYGGQALLSGAQMIGWIPHGPQIDLVIGVGPTILFLIILTWLIVKDRGSAETGNLTSRAVGAVFACAGLTNIALILAIGSIALRQQSLLIWLIYPCVVMILQGMAWLIAFMLRRRPWLGLVAAGWFVTGIVMALTIEQHEYFLIAVSFGLFAFMAIPGAALMRPARQVS